MNVIPHSARLLSSLPAEQRLDILQRNDSLREWQYVDESRTCMCCGRKLTGRHIQIWLDGDTFWFQCPTQSCPGALSDFARAGDPLFDDEVWADWCKTFSTHAADESLDEAV